MADSQRNYRTRNPQGCFTENPACKTAEWIAERFWSKVDRRSVDECWLWKGTLRRDGYGQFYIHNGERQAKIGAHRMAYQLHFGGLRRGAVVMHACDTPACVNPHHLVLGTHAKNHRDMERKGRHTHGESHPKAKLNDKSVRDIRRMSAEGSGTKALAARFSVSESTIRYVVRRARWKHVG